MKRALVKGKLETIIIVVYRIGVTRSMSLEWTGHV